MAKTLNEIQKTHRSRVIAFIPPAPKCGCGQKAEYEVYDHLEPHCTSCMLDAVDNSIPVLVRRIGGGFDNAS